MEPSKTAVSWTVSCSTRNVTHPKMRRRIENHASCTPRLPARVQEGESQNNIEITREEDWNKILEIEEQQIQAMCEKIIEFKPDLVFTEKGSRISHSTTCSKPTSPAFDESARPTTTVSPVLPVRPSYNRVDDLRDADVGTRCGLFHIEKLGE